MERGEKRKVKGLISCKTEDVRHIQAICNRTVQKNLS